ncbi:MAG: glutamate synthase domain-containing protein 2 [Psychroserpens sp.]|jgi:glutamate synthase domain-containing protein 2
MPDVDSISPNAHADIKSVKYILTMVNLIREVTGKPVGFKAVIGESLWLRNLFKEINRQDPEFAPDFMTIDSADSVTGAAPQPLMDNLLIE